jgi:hypothetical protein
MSANNSPFSNPYFEKLFWTDTSNVSGGTIEFKSPKHTWDWHIGKDKTAYSPSLSNDSIFWQNKTFASYIPWRIQAIINEKLGDDSKKVYEEIYGHLGIIAEITQILFALEQIHRTEKNTRPELLTVVQELRTQEARVRAIAPLQEKKISH